jgi:imidazolonepropionase-like amidohydrolase
VVIDGRRIAAVSPWKTAKLPKNAQVVDGTGKFLIPGLWDMHVHNTANAQTYPLYLANGVVGVRDMNGPQDAGAWRKQHASYDKPSPTIFLGSPVVDGPQPVSPRYIAVATAAQGREVVTQQKERGADFIKVYDLLPRDVYFAIADEAGKRGIPFVGHVPVSVTVAEASDAGQKSIEHLLGVALGCSGQEQALREESGGKAFQQARFPLAARAFDTYDEAKAQSLFARFVKNGTWQCPTFALMRATSRPLNDPRNLSDERLKYVAKDVRSLWNPKDLRGGGPPPPDIVRRELQQDEKLVDRMFRAGVGILAGTDTGMPYVFPGFSLHDELAIMVEAGLSPMAALQTATRNAAQFMGQLDRRGTIEAGKIADLVLLDKNPLADIHNTRSTRAVVLNGKIMPRATLDAMLAEAAAMANK